MILNTPLNIEVSVIKPIELVEEVSKKTNSKKNKSINYITSSNNNKELTVQDLITLLERIENKNTKVVINNKSNGQGEYVISVNNCKISYNNIYREDAVLIN